MSLPSFLMRLWQPSVPLYAPSRSLSPQLARPIERCARFLFRLAWESKYRLPIIFVTIYTILDIQLRLEVSIYQDRRGFLSSGSTEEFSLSDYDGYDDDDDDDDNEDDDEDGDDAGDDTAGEAYCDVPSSGSDIDHTEYSYEEDYDY